MSTIVRSTGAGSAVTVNAIAVFKKRCTTMPQGKFRVIIAGGRDFNDYQRLKDYMDWALQNIEKEIIVVSGGARGADLLGEQYANERGYSVDLHPADWEKHGKGAGFIRNREMAENADALVAFWDGKSRGTEHMINFAKTHGLNVRIVRY